MSRVKLSLALIIGVLALAALITPAVLTRAAPATTRTVQKHDAATAVTNYYAFSGVTTQGPYKNTFINGALTLDIRNSGDFFGKFVLPGKIYLNVNGKIAGSSITLNIMQANAPIVAAQGTFISSTEMTGTFNFFDDGKAAGTGNWSAVQVAAPTSDLSMSFLGKVTSGHDSKTFVGGSIVLSTTALKPGITVSGLMNLADGTLVNVRANLDHVGHLEINLYVGAHAMHLIGTGISYYNHENQTSGYQGTFVGPGPQDAGTWLTSSYAFVAS